MNVEQISFKKLNTKFLRRRSDEKLISDFIVKRHYSTHLVGLIILQGVLNCQLIRIKHTRWQ